MPTYDEYEDDHLDSAPDFLEGDEGSQIDVCFCFSNSEIFCQEELYFPASIGEKTNVSAETYKEDEVFNS